MTRDTKGLKEAIMPGYFSSAHILIGSGCLFLALTSLVHMKAGYPRLLRAISDEAIRLPSFSTETRRTLSFEEIKVMWVSFSAHLLIVSVLAFISAFCENPSAAVVIICGLVPVVDALLLKYFIKSIHLGAPLLAVSGIFIMLGGLYV